jgi:hypothetical protein
VFDPGGGAGPTPSGACRVGGGTGQLKLWDAEIARLTGELVQEAVSFEELCSAGEEKGTAILELQQVTETMHAALETEKK